MFLDRIRTFLERSCGVRSEDVPNILGTFVAAKYVIYIGFLGVGVKYRPLGRFFPTYVFRPSAVLREPKKTVEKAMSSVYMSKNYGWEFPKNPTLIERVAWFYSSYSDKIATKVSRNSVWRNISQQWLGRDPKLLALGIAEGMIAYKITIPIHVPLTLLGAVALCRTPREENEKDDEAPGLSEAAAPLHQVVMNIETITYEEGEESVVDDMTLIRRAGLRRSGLDRVFPWIWGATTKDKSAGD